MFRADQKLKQAAFSFIASQLLSKQEKESLAKVFKAIDTDGDGRLSEEELYQGYNKYMKKRMEREEIEKMFKAVDIDQSGYIDFSEFIISQMN